MSGYKRTKISFKDGSILDGRLKLCVESGVSVMEDAGGW
jgi:hypothetical protein